MADPLTPDQISQFRRAIGDYELIPDGAGGSYILSNAALQSHYDNAGGNFLLSYIYALREISGYHSVKVNLTNEFGSTEEYQGRFENSLRLLAYYEKSYVTYGDHALAGGQAEPEPTVSGLGFLDLNLDEP